MQACALGRKHVLHHVLDCTIMSTRWTHGQILALIGVWGEEEVQCLLDSSYRNKAVFQEISTRLKELQNIDVTWQQCRNKIKALKKDYREAQKAQNRSGNGRTKFRWEAFCMICAALLLYLTRGVHVPLHVYTYTCSTTYK